MAAPTHRFRRTGNYTEDQLLRDLQELDQAIQTLQANGGQVGPAGPQGNQGPVGSTGPAGQSITGPQGPAGQPGVPGPIGESGNTIWFDLLNLGYDRNYYEFLGELYSCILTNRLILSQMLERFSRDNYGWVDSDAGSAAVPADFVEDYGTIGDDS